jgi:hypothetical protein
MYRSMIIAALVSILVPVTASAKSEVQVTRTVWEISDFPDLAAKAKAVCEGATKKSDKLSKACASGQMPGVTKAGAFRNTGIGAELNTLIRQ